MTKSFYKILEKEALTARGNFILPFDEMKRQVVKIYEACGGLEAKFPYWPSDQQVKNMTEVVRWGKGDNGYALEFCSSPENMDTGFSVCFIEGVNKWVESYYHSQKEESADYLIGMLCVVTVLLVAVLACLAISHYAENKSQSRLGSVSCGSSWRFWKREAGNDGEQIPLVPFGRDPEQGRIEKLRL